MDAEHPVIYSNLIFYGRIIPHCDCNSEQFASIYKIRIENVASVGHPYSPIVACGDCGVTAKKELVEILEFMHFFEHYTFGETDWSHRGKHLEKYIRVVVAVELVTVTAKPE